MTIKCKDLKKNGNTIKEFGIYNGSWFDVEE